MAVDQQRVIKKVRRT